MQREHDPRKAALDIEVAYTRKMAAHEAEVRRLTDERWIRRLDPLLVNPDPVEIDPPGCFT